MARPSEWGQEVIGLMAKEHASLERIREVRKKEEEAGTERGWRMLPIITYQREKWFFDERLRQLRNVRNPHEWIDLNEFEMECFRGIIRRGEYV